VDMGRGQGVQKTAHFDRIADSLRSLIIAAPFC
jgi:hypothetical protein